MKHTVTKRRAAARGYGRGSDNNYTPAQYSVLDENGKEVAVIMGTSVRFMEKSTWTVNWLSEAGMPRTLRYEESFKAAKLWAETKWDGLAPTYWRTK